MAYRFALDAVLRLRELALDQEEQVLARIRAEIDRIRQSLLANEKERQQAARTLETAFSSAPLPAMHLHALCATSDALHARVGLLREQQAKFEALQTQQVERCQKAYQEREVLASLREKDRNRWLARQAAIDEKAANEAFLARQFRDRRPRAAAHLAELGKDCRADTRQTLPTGIRLPGADERSNPKADPISDLSDGVYGK